MDGGSYVGGGFLGGLVEDGGDLRAKGLGFDIRLPDALAARAKQKAAHSATLGIRPSDLEFDANAPADQSLDLNVVVSEYIGAQSVLICDCGGAKVTVELKSETPIALGETLRFAVRPDGLHLFDPTTEAAL